MRRTKVVTILLLCLVLAACKPSPENARDAIASAQGFIDSVAKAHGECNADPSGQICGVVNRANAAKHVAIDALQQYCASPEFMDRTGSCHVPEAGNVQKQLGDQLKSAIQNLNQIVSDLKALKGGK